MSKTHTCLKQVVHQFCTKLDLNNRQTIIVGLSGGPDSVALLHLLASQQINFGYKLIAAHLDHGWRTDSKQDLEFCQNLCNKLNIKLIYEHAHNLNFKPKLTGSKEDFGRQLRRYFFEQVIKEHKAQYLMLGHHLDDQIETFLIRLTRGSALAGLSCMQAITGFYLRPLLNINKIDILDYLKLQNLSYMQDSTNHSELFLRNRIRFLVPELEKLDTRFKQNFNQTLRKIQQANHFINELAQNKLAQVTQDQNLQKIDLKLFNNLDPFLQNQVMLAWLYQNQVQFTQTEKFIHEILKFFQSDHGGIHQIHQDWALVKKHNIITIQRNSK